jgi:hypothetical protein
MTFWIGMLGMSISICRDCVEHRGHGRNCGTEKSHGSIDICLSFGMSWHTGCLGLNDGFGSMFVPLENDCFVGAVLGFSPEMVIVVQSKIRDQNVGGETRPNVGASQNRIHRWT